MVRSQNRSRAQVGLRVSEAMRQRLEKAAKDRGQSINAEILARLERTFDVDDRFGGPDLVPFVNIMAGAFEAGGRRGAEARGHPEWSPGQWLQDDVAYWVAMKSVIDALVTAQPNPFCAEHPDPKQRELAAKMHDIFTTLIAREGNINVTKGDET